MPIFSKLESIPGEVLEEIVIFSIESRFLGPPTSLAALLRVSRTIWKTLARQNNPLLYARIFHCKFNVQAPTRRLGDDATCAMELGDEGVRRFEGLRRLRDNVYPRNICDDAGDGRLRDDLWMAYLMFLENDGKNVQQLVQYARIDTLTLEFVRPGGRLHDRAEDNAGWTVDTEVNALGLWLFWFTDNERVQSESVVEREDILGAIGCLHVGSFKYPSAHAPITSFSIPPAIPPPPFQPQPTFPLSGAPVHPPCTITKHFGQELTLARPLITPPAFLACLVRLRGCSGSGQRFADAPIARAEAIRLGWTGATGEVFSAYERQGTSGIEWGGEGSDRYEHDWMRLLTCYNPWDKPRIANRVFTPGQLDGVWEGRWLTVPNDYFQSLLQMTQEGCKVLMPLQPPVYQQPMQFRMREHHQYNEEDVVRFSDISSDGTGSGALRAWFPDGTRMVQRQDKLKIYDPEVRKSSRYQTYNSARAGLDEEWPSGNAPYGGRVWDIILTAETEDDFAAVWGHDYYYGRVRDWDGLVVLVRALRPSAGRWVFRGYVYGSQNMVGRWRETGTPVDSPGLEGVWGMVKSSA